MQSMVMYFGSSKGEIVFTLGVFVKWETKRVVLLCISHYFFDFVPFLCSKHQNILTLIAFKRSFQRWCSFSVDFPSFVNE